METKKRGRPRKVHVQELETESEPSPKAPAKTPDDVKAQKLQYKHDHIDEIREQQNARYQQIKDQLQLKRLSNNMFSERFTDKQRLQLLEELNQWKKKILEKEDVNS